MWRALRFCIAALGTIVDESCAEPHCTSIRNEVTIDTTCIALQQSDIVIHRRSSVVIRRGIPHKPHLDARPSTEPDAEHTAFVFVSSHTHRSNAQAGLCKSRRSRLPHSPMLRPPLGEYTSRHPHQPIVTAGVSNASFLHPPRSHSSPICSLACLASSFHTLTTLPGA